MKIVVAPDSFKGSLSSIEIAEAIEKGILKADPSVEVVKIPMADGGEGTVQALVRATRGRIIPVKVTGPLLREVDAFYGISGDGRTAFIEVASASGLALLNCNEYNVMKANSYGTGELIIHALDQGCRDIIIGLGGSATNDGGVGLLQALGIRFFDRYQFDLAFGGGSLENLYGFDVSKLDPRIKETQFILACDVDNPLYGPKGASVIFGPQKGANQEEVLCLDNYLRHFAFLIERDLGRQVAEIPGAGAAGGTGAGLMAFLDANIVKGINLIIEATGLDKSLAGADYVITGEGKVDSQTSFGKAPLGIAQLAKKRGIPVIGIAGEVGQDINQLYELGFTSIFAIADRPMTQDVSISEAKQLTTKLAENIARLLMAKQC
jgi:glycerate kinase